MSELLSVIWEPIATSMGGYGRYLWPCFALGFGVVLLNVWLAMRSLANARREARRRLEMNS